MVTFRFPLQATLVLLLAGACATTPPANRIVVQPFADGKHWMLTEPLAYKPSGSNVALVVPAGFVTDFASLPRALCSLLPPAGKYLAAVIIHDFLYWDQSCDRQIADRMLATVLKDSEVNRVQGGLIQAGVRVVGIGGWNINARMKREGRIRILPPAEQRPPMDVTWDEYEAGLIARKVAEHYRKPSSENCAALLP
jgi:hypothetical protein